MGPTAEGEIPPESIQRLKEIGAWLKVNGEAIYGTTASPFAAPAWGRYTKKPGKLYAIVLKWPTAGKLDIKSDGYAFRSAVLLGSGTALEMTPCEGGVCFSIPKQAPNPIASVVELELKDGVNWK